MSIWEQCGIREKSCPHQFWDNLFISAFSSAAGVSQDSTPQPHQDDLHWHLAHFLLSFHPDTAVECHLSLLRALWSSR